MKILQVNSDYKIGSTGKITFDIHSTLLSKGYNSIVCYGRNNHIKEKNVYPLISTFWSKILHGFSIFDGSHYNKAFFATRKLINIIKKEKPDVVHLHCLNGYFINIYRLITWLKDNKIKTILTLHAEFMYTGNCGYSFDCDKWKSGCGKCPEISRNCGTKIIDRTSKNWLEMKKSFDGFDNITIVSVSSWLMERAKQSPILGDKKHVVIMNGVDTNIFKHYESSEIPDTIKKDFTKKTILHVTPNFMSSVKGGAYVIELAKKLPQYNFIVIGAEGNEEVPSNVTLIKHTNNQKELAMYYSMADLTLLTSKRETFSMIVAESLCCGTPIVGFKAGGPETITIKEYSEFVEYDNVEKLQKSIVDFIDNGFNRNIICETAFIKYNKNNMTDLYLKLYK